MHADGVFGGVVKKLETGRTYYRARAVNEEGVGRSVIGRFKALHPDLATGVWKGSRPQEIRGGCIHPYGLVYLGNDWAYHQSLGWIHVHGESNRDV